MKLVKLILEDYRSYHKLTVIDFNDLTALIGCNDAGKSTVLDALNSFFNESEFEVTSDDICKTHAEINKCSISCVFTDFPSEIIIDETAVTNLREEYLLNKEGLLEIRKEWENTGAAKLKSSVFCKAYHPDNENLKDLLSLNNTQLKARAEKLQITQGFNAGINHEIRAAIRNSIADKDKNLKETDIRIDDKSLKDCWGKIQKYMPLYALFKSDRASTDADQEAQDPMMIAVEMALKGMQDDLEKIVSTVSGRIAEVTDRTLTELKKISPKLASELVPVLPKKEKIKWKSLFKSSIACENNIPINKKGSGTRRLILISFFKAELERRRGLHEYTDVDDVIFAIEEPETSQHPSNVRRIIETLKDLSDEENCQVILTTHVPALAKEVQIEDIRFVHKDDEDHPVIDSVLTQKDKSFLKEIVETLDISSFYSEVLYKKLKVLVYLEGPNDIRLIKDFSRLLNSIASNNINLNDETVALIPLGGNCLKDWVDDNYLAGLGLPQIYIFDGDRKDYEEKAKEINDEKDDRRIAFTTKPYMTLENLLSKDKIKMVLLSRHAGIPEGGCVIDFSYTDDVSSWLARYIYEYDGQKSFDELDECKQKKRISRIKKWLNSEVAKKMSPDEIVASDSAGLMPRILGTINNYTQGIYKLYDS